MLYTTASLSSLCVRVCWKAERCTLCVECVVVVRGRQWMGVWDLWISLTQEARVKRETESACCGEAVGSSCGVMGGL